MSKASKILRNLANKIDDMSPDEFEKNFGKNVDISNYIGVVMDDQIKQADEILNRLNYWFVPGKGYMHISYMHDIDYEKAGLNKNNLKTCINCGLRFMPDEILDDDSPYCCGECDQYRI
jgi:hypothetical protein